MNKKIVIAGEEITEAMNWRTTKKIKAALEEEAKGKNESANNMLNIVLEKRYQKKLKP